MLEMCVCVRMCFFIHFSHSLSCVSFFFLYIYSQTEFGNIPGGIGQSMSRGECGNVVDTVESTIDTRIRRMAAVVGRQVDSNLPKPPRYQLYKELSTQVFGVTGKLDGDEGGSQTPLDRSVTRDLRVRPFLPFCVDVSLCPSQQSNDRMQRYFEITHEQGSSIAAATTTETRPMRNAPSPPGWSAGAAGSGSSGLEAPAGSVATPGSASSSPVSSGSASGGKSAMKTRASLLRFLEEEEQIESAKPIRRSSHLAWLQETELHRRSLRFERTNLAYQKEEIAAQQRIADAIVDERLKKSTQQH